MKNVGTYLLLTLLVVAAVFPWLLADPTAVSIGVFTLLFVSAATAWNIFSGYTGYMSLGHGVFFGVGAYTLALLCNDWHIQGGYLPFLLLPLGGLVACLFALPIGWVALHTRRHTFVVITLSTLFLFQLLAYNLPTITYGSRGLLLPFPSWGGDFFNIPFYYVSLLLALLTITVSWWIRHSKYGLSLLAIRDDEGRALGLGVRSGVYKLAAFVVAAFFVGMVGGMVVYFEGVIYPPVGFDPRFDLSVALMSFLGGLGTLAGPIVGALLLEPLQQYLILQFGTIGLDLILFGMLLLLVLLLLPRGIVPALRRIWEQRLPLRWKREGAKL